MIMSEERETPKKHIRHHTRGVPSETKLNVPGNIAILIPL